MNPFIILLMSSDIILLILWIINVQQLCITNRHNRKRGRTACSIVLFSFGGIMLNTLTYLSTLYPNYQFIFKLSIITVVIEGITMIFGFHLFCILILSLIQQLYMSINKDPPQWIKKSFIISSVIVSITVLLCYSLYFVITAVNFVNIFYIVLGFIVLILGTILIYISFEILKALTNAHIYPANSRQIRSAKFAIQFAIFIIFIIEIGAVFTIVIQMQIVWNFVNISFNQTLVDNILHSFFLIFLIGGLILLTYQKNTCCKIPKNSICISSGCADLCDLCGVICCMQSLEEQNAYNPIYNEETTPELLMKQSTRTIGNVTENDVNTLSTITPMDDHSINN
eukprot:435409_1